MSYEHMTIGERIAYIRKRRGMRQSDLAARAGTTQAAISNYEMGLRSVPEKLDAIAQALDVGYNWLKYGRNTLDAPGVAESGPSITDAQNLYSKAIATPAQRSQNVNAEQLNINIITSAITRSASRLSHEQAKKIASIIDRTAKKAPMQNHIVI